MCYQVLFSKIQNFFSAGKRALTEFVLQILLRDVEWIWSLMSLQISSDQLLQGEACGRHSALGGKRIQKKCPFWHVHANLSHCFSRSLQCCFGASKKWMGGLLLSIPVGSQMTKYLVTSLHGLNYAWERKLDPAHTYLVVKQKSQEGF